MKQRQTDRDRDRDRDKGVGAPVSYWISLVYLLLPVFREELQGAFLKVFKPFFRQFSVYLSVDFSKENRRKSFYLLLKAF